MWALVIELIVTLFRGTFVCQVLYLVSSTAECFLSRKYGLRVGAPYGGVCLPKDVPELTSLAPEGSVFREFLSGTGNINEWITNTPNLKVRGLFHWNVW